MIINQIFTIELKEEKYVNADNLKKYLSKKYKIKNVKFIKERRISLIGYIYS